MKTPEWIIGMTDAEYKAWVERGSFPERLRPVVEAERKAKQKKKETATAAAEKEANE